MTDKFHKPHEESPSQSHSQKQSEKTPEFKSEHKPVEHKHLAESKSDIVSELGKSASVQMQNSIRRNTEFNNRLELENSGRLIPEVPSKPLTDIDSKLKEIEQVLKDKGMDSQQVLQAMSMIRSILDASLGGK